jgi:adenylate kinase family enzyme
MDSEIYINVYKLLVQKSKGHAGWICDGFPRNASEVQILAQDNQLAKFFLIIKGGNSRF